MTIFNRIKRNIPTLFRFGIVGSVGSVINFIVYFVATGVVHLNVNMSAIFAFCVAVSNNYALNHLWTFKADNEHNPINFRQFIYYVVGNIQGLIINLVTLNLIVFFMGMNYHIWGQVSGIFLGMLSNFLIAKIFVFNRRHTNATGQ